MARSTSPYLAVDEREVLRVRRHPWVLARSFLEALAAMVVAAVIGYVLSPDDGSSVVDTVVGLIAVGVSLRFVYRLWEWHNDRVIVTTQRVVEISGVVTRRVASMPLIKVTDMTYRRTILGRLLGFGDLVLESAGQKQAIESIDHIPAPDHFYRTVTALVTAKAAAQTPPAEDAGPNDGADEDTGEIPRVIV